MLRPYLPLSILALLANACAPGVDREPTPSSHEDPVTDAGSYLPPPTGNDASTPDPTGGDDAGMPAVDAGAPGGGSCKADDDCMIEDAVCFPGDGCEVSDAHPGTCAKPPESCPDTCNTVCGCDGVRYANACRAEQAGVGLAPEGDCAPCTEIDAHGAGGSCGGAPWGFKWTGSDCVLVRGCSCEGSDCDALMTYSECEEHRRSCECG